MVRIAVVITAVKPHVADLTLCVGPSMMPTFNPKGDVVVVSYNRKHLMANVLQVCKRQQMAWPPRFASW